MTELLEGASDVPALASGQSVAAAENISAAALGGSSLSAVALDSLKAASSGQGRILGVGVDVVYIPEFMAQIRQPGSTFARTGASENPPAQRIFSDREYRLASARSASTGRSLEYHLAAKYAAKEAFIKAWSLILLGEKPPLENPDFSCIEILSDAWNRPYVQLQSPLKQVVEESAGGIMSLLSLSHDGDYALASIVLYADEKTNL